MRVLPLLLALAWLGELAGAGAAAPPPTHYTLAVDGAAFVRGYGALKARGLVFENRRFLQFTYGTLADALKHDEFRVKDIAGNDNQIVYELEHEIRTLNHPGFVAKRHVRQEL